MKATKAKAVRKNSKAQTPNPDRMETARQELRNEGFAITREWHVFEQPEQEVWCDGKRLVLLDDGKRRTITAAELFDWWTPLSNDNVSVGSEPQGELNWLQYMRNSVVFVSLTPTEIAAIKLCAEGRHKGSVQDWMLEAVQSTLRGDLESVGDWLEKGKANP